MDICYIYCKQIPESKGSFYALPVLRMAKMFENSDHSIHVIGIGELDTDTLEQCGAICHVYERRLRWLGMLGLYLQLLFVALYHGWREGYDVFSNIWAHYNLAPVLIAASILDADVFARVFGQGNPWDRERASERIRTGAWRYRGRILLSQFLNAIECRILNTSSHVYSNAESVRQILVNHGVTRNHISVVTQGVDTEFFRPISDSPTAKDILFVGRISSDEKRFKDALSAFEAVQETLPEVTLNVVGSGKLPTELANRVDKNPSIHLQGYQDREELRETYQSASVLLLTSSKEGVPNVILEGLACGLPVVGTSAGDVERILSKSNGGRVVPVGDVERLSVALQQLLEDEPLRAKMGYQGRKYVVEEHAFPVAAEKYIEMFTTRKLDK